MTRMCFIYARFEVFTEGRPIVALFWDMTLHNRIRKFPANTWSLSSWRVEIPNRRLLRHFIYWRRGKNASSKRRDPITQRCSIISQKNEPSISLLLKMGSWSPLCTYKTCSLQSYHYHGMLEASLLWKWNNLGGVQQSCWYRCKQNNL
jgi:hypothetical protein